MTIKEGAIKPTERIRIEFFGCYGGDWTVEDGIPVAVKTWYDRSAKHYEIWLVDAEGNQVGETNYGFGKEEVRRIVKELESELEGKTMESEDKEVKTMPNRWWEPGCEDANQEETQEPWIDEEPLF